MQVIATQPAAGAHVPPDTDITARVRLGGAPPKDLTLRVDGVDVTARCSLRTDLAHPPLRADVFLAGPLDAGEHRIVLGLGPGHGTHAWRFTVRESDGDSATEEGGAMISAKEDDR